MKNFPQYPILPIYSECSILTPEFSICYSPIPSRPLSMAETATIVYDKQGNPHVTQEIHSKKLNFEKTFVPIKQHDQLPKNAVIVAEVPDHKEFSP